MTRVAVLGATGEMGQRLARLIRRWIPSAQVIGANRSGRGHPDFPVRPVDVSDAPALAEFAAGADLLVNCVGPYDHDPTPIVKACVDGSCHYADLAEIPAYVVRVRRAANAYDARRRGVAVAAGCSTVPGLAQLLATRWRRLQDVASVDAFLSMASKSRGSRALLTGLIGPLGRPGPRGRWYDGTTLIQTSSGRAIRAGSYPAAFPTSGVRIGDRRVPFRFHMGFDRAWIGRLLALSAPMLGRLPSRSLPALAALLLPFARIAAWVGTPRGVLLQIARDAQGQELARVEIVARANGLDVPAAPALWLASRLARTGALPVAGAVELDQLVAWEDACDWFLGAGYEVLERG